MSLPSAESLVTDESQVELYSDDPCLERRFVDFLARSDLHTFLSPFSYNLIFYVIILSLISQAISTEHFLRVNLYSLGSL